jgi:hypothetical protein
MKKHYLAPVVELFPMESTVTCLSGSSTATPGYGEGASFGSAASSSSTYGTGTNYSASGSDLEEMINDILTY